MVYACGQDPATVTFEEVMIGLPSQLSVAVAVPVVAGNVLDVQSMVTFAGQVISGTVVSTIQMV